MTRISRMLMVLLLLAASACSSADDQNAGSGSADGGSASPSARGSGSNGNPDTGASGGGSSDGPDSGSSTGSGSGAGGTASGPSSTDAGPLGSLVRTFLRASPAKRLKVEIDYVNGRAPSQSAMQHLDRVLGEVCDKPSGVSVAAGNVVGSGRARWTIKDLQALEKQHRASRTGGDSAAMWIVYVNGSFADEPSALGVAYAASSAAIFRDRIDDATTALVNAAGIERAVLTHEAGHLLALVNIGYTSRIAHEDPDRRGHSRNQGSVMFWAVEDVSVRNILTGGPPSTFDDDDKADLAMLKGS